MDKFKGWIVRMVFGMFRAMSHKGQDWASLEMAQRIAAGLRDGSVSIDLALENLDRWSVRNANAPALLRCYEEWREILSLPVEEICAVLCSETDEGQRLRQNSPFAGALSAEEVWEIKSRHYATPTA